MRIYLQKLGNKLIFCEFIYIPWDELKLIHAGDKKSMRISKDKK